MLSRLWGVPSSKRTRSPHLPSRRPHARKARPLVGCRSRGPSVPVPRPRTLTRCEFADYVALWIWASAPEGSKTVGVTVFDLPASDAHWHWQSSDDEQPGGYPRQSHVGPGRRHDNDQDDASHFQRRGVGCTRYGGGGPAEQPRRQGLASVLLSASGPGGWLPVAVCLCTACTLSH